MAPNFAILSIPAYWALSLVPHLLATTLAANGNARTLENRNPRGVDNVAKLKTKLGADRFARWERLRSAHTNCLENLPLFAAAVLSGVLADGVGKGGILAGHATGQQTTRFIYGWFAVRVVYIAAYVTINDNIAALLRTAIYMAGAGLALQQFWYAANVLGN